MSKDRIWSEAAETRNHKTVDIADEKVAKAQEFSIDIKPEAEAPPTRMQRKYRRIFGKTMQTSGKFAQGFMMGATVGGIFGGLFGTYQAI